MTGVRAVGALPTSNTEQPVSRDEIVPPLRECIKQQLDSVIHSARIAGLRHLAKALPERNLRRSKAKLLAMVGPRTKAAVSWGRLVSRIRQLEKENEALRGGSHTPTPEPPQ